MASQSTGPGDVSIGKGPRDIRDWGLPVLVFVMVLSMLHPRARQAYRAPGQPRWQANELLRSRRFGKALEGARAGLPRNARRGESSPPGGRSSRISAPGPGMSQHDGVRRNGAPGAYRKAEAGPGHTRHLWQIVTQMSRASLATQAPWRRSRSRSRASVCAPTSTQPGATGSERCDSTPGIPMSERRFLWTVAGIGGHPAQCHEPMPHRALWAGVVGSSGSPARWRRAHADRRCEIETGPQWPSQRCVQDRGDAVLRVLGFASGARRPHRIRAKGELRDDALASGTAPSISIS